MFTPTPSKVSHSYFKNAVGELLAHPLGHYITVEYYTGPRQPADLIAFITQAGQMLARWGWDKLSSERGQMPPLSPIEEAWLGTTVCDSPLRGAPVAARYVCPPFLAVQSPRGYQLVQVRSTSAHKDHLPKSRCNTRQAPLTTGLFVANTTSTWY
jgi:hypothetical protein